MSTTIINGEQVANQLLHSILKEVDFLNIKPSLAVVRVGDDPASETYVKKKIKVCDQIGFQSSLHSFPSTISQEKLKKFVSGLNSVYDGILVQLPLPAHINKCDILNVIDPDRDVDCFTAINVGKLAQGNAILKPCTPSGILAILDFYKIQTQGKHVVIINRSQVVGQPLALLLQQEPYDATVTVCHEYTTNLTHYVEMADIVVTAVGKYPNFIFPVDHVKQKAVIIDVAMNRLNGKLFGDIIDFGLAKKQVSEGFITPVPKGVGPTTVACLMQNTLMAAKLNRKNS